MRSALNQVNALLCGGKQTFFPCTKRKAANLKRITVSFSISMLTICGKLFEKFIFDEIYDHVVKND